MLTDLRSDDFFGLSSPVPSIIICIAYVILVKWILPKYMENRKAYELRTIMMYYNFAMVILSGYICLEVSVF